MRPTRVHLLCAIALSTACASEQDLIRDVEAIGRYNPRPPIPLERTDVLVQDTTPEIDVLFVVDNSCSMQTSQDELALNFPVFFEFFLGSGVDYHIGVTSTDMNDPSHSGRLRQVAGERWITEETPQAEDVFAQMVQLGTGGAGVEKGIAAAYSALELHRDGYNAGFRRDGAGLMVVAISDEQDQSGNTPVSPSEFAAYLNAEREIGVEVSFSSIVQLAGFDAGTRYLQVTNAVGGIAWDITSQDWEPVLEQLGIEAIGLSRRFFLSQLPVESTIEVLVMDEDEVTRAMQREIDWVYDGEINAVVFHTFVPEALSRVQIRYEVLSASEGLGT